MDRTDRHDRRHFGAHGYGAHDEQEGQEGQPGSHGPRPGRFGMGFGGPGPGRGPHRGGPGFGPGGGPRGPFGGFGGGPFGGFGGPGFRRGRKAGRGDVRTAALDLLTEQPLHGYQIIQLIAERSGGLWRPSAGSIYPMLQQLADEGLVRMEESDGRRVFHLTEAGQTYVREHQAEIAAVWDAVNEGTDEGVRELGELIGQVSVASMQVAQAGTATQIAAARQALAATRRQLYRILAEDDPAPNTQSAADAPVTDR